MDEQHQHIEEDITEEYSREDRAAELYSKKERITNIVWLIFGIIEILLAFRFVLRLLGANPESGFADFIYSLSGVFMAPFFGLFDEPAFNGGVFEWSTLVAIFAYLVLAWIIVRIIEVIIVPSHIRSDEGINRRRTLGV